MAELFDIIAECVLTGHKYADNTQVYISTAATDHIDAMDWLAACMERIRDWMANDHLKLIEEKTRIIWLDTRQQLNKVTARALTLPNDTVEFSTTVKDLSIVLDSHLTMADHIAALSRSCFFYIQQLRSTRQSFTTDAMKTLVYAFVSSRIDYCNRILGVSGQLLQRLQSVQNAAACLVTGARRSDCMTPILCQLHWLPVCQRITFKTAMLVYKCRHGMTLPYLSTYCESTSMSTASRRHHTTVGVACALPSPVN